VTVLLYDQLEKRGFKCKLDHKSLNGDGFHRELPTVYRHNILSNAAGETILLFEHHHEAVRAAAVLRKLFLPASDSAAKILDTAGVQSSRSSSSAGGGAGVGVGEEADAPTRGRRKGTIADATAALVSKSASDAVRDGSGVGGGEGEGGASGQEDWRAAPPVGQLSIGWCTLEEAKMRGMSRPERFLPATR
jgi:hypothetical protein